jgi:hypothetical protein
MEQLLVRIYDTELAQFYLKYREAQSGNVARQVPPGKKSVQLPPVKVTAKVKGSRELAKLLFFNVTLTDLETEKTLCFVHVDAQSYHNDLAAQLGWCVEADDFASGFLDWLRGNFNTDAPPQRAVKDFVVAGTAKGFATVVDLAAAQLREKFTDGWYGVKCLDSSCQTYAIVKQWPSKVDPERTQEREIVTFSVPGTGGEKLRVRAEYTQLGDAPNEQAELALSVIAAHYPESGLAVGVAKTTTREERGPNAGTESKVLEAHKRLKSGAAWKTVKRVCSHETYMKWCLPVTGEEPITK